jgi:uncharacterized membrane protein
MDPSPLAIAEWTDISSLITNLGIMVGLVVFMATNALIGLIFIPSLVASYHIPAKVQKIRPLFYGLAIVSFVLTVVVLVQVIALSDVISRIYDTYWIDGGLG